jgi:DNA-binding NtrC family response regulator
MNKLLLVDDEAHVRMLYEQTLSRDGYDIVTVATAEEALETLRRNNRDLIILDIELEESSGLDILKDLKREFPDIPVILNTAYAVYKSDFHTWVADAYVVKSSDMEPLKEKIRELAHA